MTVHLPIRSRSYQSAMLDSARWDHYIPRNDDVIVATPYKSGTTWTLNIVRRLIAVGREVPPYQEMWVDSRFQWELPELIDALESKEERRYIKTHLALDGLPYFPQVKYIVVGRDARDVFMSLWNHYLAVAERQLIEQINSIPGRIGPPLPPPPDDIHEAWRNWITKGTFAWEHEGWPFWGNMHHMQTWWDFRHLENILFLHFNDLKADLVAQIRRVAEFLEIEASDQEIEDMMPKLNLDAMREEAMAKSKDPELDRRFFFKGTNGRWRDVLSQEELELYEETAVRVLSPDCRDWLERGVFS